VKKLTCLFAASWITQRRKTLAQSHNVRRQVMEKHSGFVGPDVHKNSIDVSIAEEERTSEVRSLREDSEQVAIGRSLFE